MSPKINSILNKKIRKQNLNFIIKILYPKSRFKKLAGRIKKSMNSCNIKLTQFSTVTAVNVERLITLVDLSETWVKH